MQREELADLNAFLTVAEEQSFTRAAAKLGTSQSALSYTIRRLETRLGVRLLTRTTRRGAPTEAGERLLKTLGPALNDIAAELSSLSELRKKPAGTIRITTSEHAANTVLWPVLQKLLPDYPDVHVELTIDSGLTDIVAERFDVGVRLGESIAKDMVAVRIGPDLCVAVVGSPAYFAHHAKPRTPQDLARHQCINLRLPTAGGLYAWELGKGERDLRVRVEGQLVFNNVPMNPSRRSGWVRPSLRVGRPGRSACRRRQPRARAGGLVSAVRRLSSLLPESAPAFGGICAAR
jgi:DNA-binding transcriptional LysR family regulator